MPLPTRTIASLAGITRYQFDAIVDYSGTDPFMSMTDESGKFAGFLMNFAALFDTNGKFNLSNSIADNGIGPAQLQDIIQVVHLGAPALNGTGGTKIVTAANLTTNKTSTYTINADVDVPRNVEVVIIDSTPSITSGVVTVAGLGVDGNALSETFDIGEGAGTYVGTKIFASVTSVTNGAVTTLGGGGDETIAVWRGKVIGLGMPVSYGYGVAATANYIVESADFTDGLNVVEFAHQPDIPRNVTLAITDTGASIVAGTVTVTGTDQYDAVATESFDLSSALTFTGSQIFKTITSITSADVTVLDGASDETYVVGVGGVVLRDVRAVYLGTAKVAAPVVATGNFTTAGIDVSGSTYDGSKALRAYVSPL